MEKNVEDVNSTLGAEQDAFDSIVRGIADAISEAFGLDAKAVRGLLDNSVALARGWERESKRKAEWTKTVAKLEAEYLRKSSPCLDRMESIATGIEAKLLTRNRRSAGTIANAASLAIANGNSQACIEKLIARHLAERSAAEFAFLQALVSLRASNDLDS